MIKVAVNALVLWLAWTTVNQVMRDPALSTQRAAFAAKLRPLSDTVAPLVAGQLQPLCESVAPLTRAVAAAATEAVGPHLAVMNALCTRVHADVVSGISRHVDVVSIEQVANHLLSDGHALLRELVVWSGATPMASNQPASADQAGTPAQAGAGNDDDEYVWQVCTRHVVLPARAVACPPSPFLQNASDAVLRRNLSRSLGETDKVATRGSTLSKATLPCSLLALSLTALALHLRPPVRRNSQSASSNAKLAAAIALQDSSCRSMQNASLAPLRVPHRRAEFFDGT